jgi:hypothetical protein
MYKKTQHVKFPTLKKYSNLSKEPTAKHTVTITREYYRQSDFTEERTPVLKDGSEEVPAEQRLHAYRVRPFHLVLAVLCVRALPIYPALGAVRKSRATSEMDVAIRSWFLIRHRASSASWASTPSIQYTASVRWIDDKGARLGFWTVWQGLCAHLG